MAQLHLLKTYSSDNGNLTVFDDLLPGTIQRIFYIYGTGPHPRAGHRHHKAWQALICLSGHCQIYCHNGEAETVYRLNEPSQCLVLPPEDWHLMTDFSPDTILLVVSNEPYDQADYIYQPYAAVSLTNELSLADPQ